jgi:hypothetical protein
MTAAYAREENEMSATAVAPDLLQTILNLSHFHHEHEKFYAQAPLERAVALHRSSRSLKALADHWRRAEPQEAPAANPYAGCVDLNDTTAIAEGGILFLEGEGEPAEIGQLKRDLRALAEGFVSTGEWLEEAMTSSWETARLLLAQPAFADLLGERHRIIANDRQAAALNTLIGALLGRALEVLEQVDFTPSALRSDLAGPRSSAAFLYSASELIDHAADLVATSAMLVHDNERRWRVFHDRVAAIAGRDAHDGD